MSLLFRILTASILVLTVASTAQAADSAQPFTVTVSGHGAPMLFLPGLGSSGAVFDQAVAHFQQRYECHVITFAGFAGVPAQAGPFVEREEAALSEYIDAHHLRKPIVIGHSLGGFMALKLAADHPLQVGPVVVLDALPALGAIGNPDITAEQLSTIAAGMRAQMDSATAAQFRDQMHDNITQWVTNPQDVALVQAWGDASDRATVTNAMAELFASDLRTRLTQISTPTLVLASWIAYQKYTTQQAVAKTYALQYSNLKGVTIEVSDSARHFVMLDDPAWTANRIDTFLAAHS